MNSLQHGIQSVRTFFAEVGNEIRKIAWPERQELLESTVVVIVSVLLLGFTVGLFDKLLITLVRWITS